MKLTARNSDWYGMRILTKTLLIILLAAPVFAMTRIRDVARPMGERTNRLHGLGLVIGLNGTGDSADSLVAVGPMRELLQKLGNPVSIEDLGGMQNTALVQVTAEIGRNGAREGDRVDVEVASLYDAQDLTGGTLTMSFLRSSNAADDRVYAVAGGSVTVLNPDNPRSGVIRGGADMEADIFYQYVHYNRQGEGTFTLVLDEEQSNWQSATYLAMIIDQELSAPGASYSEMSNMNSAMREPMAIAIDARNVLVRIPRSRLDRPADFIANIMGIVIPDLPEPEATVVINQRAGTIAITGNVEIAPVSVCVAGLLIRIEQQPNGASVPVGPNATSWAQFDTEEVGGTKIDDLIDALDQLNVPIEQKIEAIYAIERAGALRATLIAQ